MKPVTEINTVHLFPELDRLLIACLRNLRPEDWRVQTSAGSWTVRDVAIHLLDGNIRLVSAMRDHHFAPAPNDLSSYEATVQFLNTLNADWIKAFERVSPAMICELLEITGAWYCAYLKTIRHDDDAVFPVAWAGESFSKNWFHVAREYTEKWHHQQQIRSSLGDEMTLLQNVWYLPYLDTSMRALPHVYRNMPAPDGIVLQFSVSDLTDANWFLKRNNNKWELFSGTDPKPHAYMCIEKKAAWRIFTKNLNGERARPYIHMLEGDDFWLNPLLNMVAVMA